MSSPAPSITGERQDLPHRRRTLGVVMLDTRFPRLVGDIGNPATFPGLTVRYRVVPAATVGRVITDDGMDDAVIAGIVAAAEKLSREGVDLIATSCGFLGGLQARLQGAVSCPVIASALTCVPRIRRDVGDESVIGVLTFDSRKLRASHFGVDAGAVAVAGIESGATLYPAISQNRPWFDPAAAAADACAAARALKASAPDMTAAILECTNLAPYREAIVAILGVPVHDITTLIRGVLHSVSPADLAGGNPWRPGP